MIYNAEEYFVHIEDQNLRETAIILHQFLLSYSMIRSKISYHIPFYYRNRWMCYINHTKTKTIELAFVYGIALRNEGGLLLANKRKQVMGVSFCSPDEIPFESLDSIVENAIEIDEQKNFTITSMKK
jgi:hypothetical protein